MKKISFIVSVLCAAMISAQVSVNINPNTTPISGELDVNGGLLIESYLILEKTEAVTGNFYLLVRSDDSTPVGELKKLDVDLRNVGPVNKYTAEISNVNDAEILTLNTNLSTDKYFLGLAEAYFTGAEVVNSTMDNSNPVHGTYKTAVGQTGNNYNISLGFNQSGTRNGVNGKWTVSFVVFEKVLVKDWGVVDNQSVSPSANYYGTSNNTPLGLQ